MDRKALATMLGLRLQAIETSLQQPKAAAGEGLSGAERAELERQQVAIKRALSLTDRTGWLMQEPVVVDATLRQLLGPLSSVLASPDGSGVDHLA
jgi:hypothetical protein